MAFGYLNLFFCDVSAHFNKFHAVEQRTWNGVQVVGCGDEEHLGQVEVHVKIVVVERVVLFRIEHFEQS